MITKIIIGILALLLLVMIIFSITSYNRMLKVYHLYDKEFVYCSINGLEFAGYMVKKLGLKTKVCLIENELGECYLPKKDVVCISTHTAETSSVSSICVTAHEFGHAVQKRSKSFLFVFQEFLITMSKIFTFLFPFMIIAGIVFIFFEQYYDLATTLFIVSLGSIVLMFLLKIFTVPMEAEASKIAYNFLKDNNVLNPDELKHGKKVLNAAIGTYVASIFYPIINFLKGLGRMFRR